MIIKKTCIIKNQILMIGLNERYEYKIFALNMIPDKFDVSGNPIQGFDAISPNFEVLEHLHKNGLNKYEFEKMFTKDWDFLMNKINKDK